MNYTRRIDTDKAVEMQISSFTGKGGTTEYQVMVSITDPCLSFVEQLQNLLGGLCDCGEGRATEGRYRRFPPLFFK